MALSPEPAKLTSTPSSPWAAAGLAIALYIAVIDAAVETFLSGSPVRWWVVGVLAVYLAASMALWRYRPSLWQRMGWSARASASLFLLLGLLAFTVWLPGGLTEGIRVAGQSTSRVLSLFTTVVIVLVGVSLVRLAWLPRWAKVLAGLLAAYGLAAFVTGMVSGAEFAALLHGDSLWTRLPAWLQGAFLGALVVVPLGLLVKAAPALLRRREQPTGTLSAYQMIALAMSFVISLSGVTGPIATGSNIAGAIQVGYKELDSAIIPKTVAGSSEKPDAQLDRFFSLIDSVNRRIPRDTFDTEAVVAAVGPDPSRLFAWVRDNTRLVPYRGVLRGETGVLMDRVGNSLDRAILLYSLLKAAGQPARLATGELSSEQATKILESLNARPPRPPSSVASAEEDFLNAYAEQFQVDRRSIQSARDAAEREARRAREMLARKVEAQSATLLRLLRRRSGGGPQPDIDALRNHWWVQWMNGREWVDLDPTLPTATPATALTTPRGFFQPAKPRDLGQDLQHTVTLRVIVEQWMDGRLREQKALEQVLQPSELIGQRISVSHYPMKWPKDPGTLLAEKDRIAALKKVVLQQSEWAPILTIGSGHVIQSSFTDAGEINQTPFAPLLGSAAQNLGGTIGGMLHSGSINQPSERAPATPGSLTAEWLEYEIHCPGHPVRTLRRQIFDLVGPARRTSSTLAMPPLSEADRLDRGMSLLGESQILPLVADPSPEFVEHLDLQTFLANRSVVGKLLAAGRSKALGVLSANAGNVSLPSRRLYALALARVLSSDSAADLYLDRLNILTYSSSLGLSSDLKIVRVRKVDIVANEVAVRPNTRSYAFAARLRHGVLDTNLEVLFAAPDRELGCCTVSFNTATLFDASGAPTSWLAVSAGDNAAIGRSSLPAGARARLAADVASGFDVVTPTSAVSIEGRERAAWWRVDPATGDTLGIGDDGGGDEVEYEMQVQAVEAAVSASLMLACLFLTGGTFAHPSRDITPRPGPPSAEGAICILAWLTDGTATAMLGFVGLGVLIGMVVEKLMEFGWETYEERKFFNE